MLLGDVPSRGQLLSSLSSDQHRYLCRAGPFVCSPADCDGVVRSGRRLHSRNARRLKHGAIPGGLAAVAAADQAPAAASFGKRIVH